MNEIIDGEKVNTFLDIAGKIILLCDLTYLTSLFHSWDTPNWTCPWKEDKLKYDLVIKIA